MALVTFTTFWICLFQSLYSMMLTEHVVHTALLNSCWISGFRFAWWLDTFQFWWDDNSLGWQQDIRPLKLEGKETNNRPSKDSCLLWCSTGSLGKQFLMFWRHCSALKYWQVFTQWECNVPQDLNLEQHCCKNILLCKPCLHTTSYNRNVPVFFFWAELVSNIVY